MKDPEFWNAVAKTATYVFVAVGIEVILGLVIALLIASRQSWFARIFRRLVLLPFMLAPAVVGLVWLWILNPELGILNYLLTASGILEQGLVWTGNVRTAMPTIIFIDVWQWTPFVILFFMAGISSLPVEPYDAARVDGANRWQVIRYVTLPLLKYVILLVTLIRMMTAFKFIETIFVLTHGGPAGSTEVLGFYTYRVGFMHFNMGYASALCYIMLIIVMGLSISLIRILEKR
jgi:multiple sugar transport system permease protein